MKKTYGYLALLLIAFFAVSCGGGGGGGGVVVPTPIPTPTPTTGTALLSWSTPTLNDDGSALTDLAGFNVKYGTSSNHYTNTINVPNAAATAYTVTNLPAGATYYFVVTAYTSTVESTTSNEAHKKI